MMDTMCCSIAIPEPVPTTTNSRLKIPNRHVFQQKLREYNENISETIQKMARIVGGNNVVGTLEVLKHSRQEPCEKRELLKREADRMKIEIEEIKKKLFEKETLLSDIENDLVYKDESRLTARLNELERAYSQTKFTSNRTEKALVKEIDKLKRNRTKLTKYNILMEEKRAIQLKLRGMNERRSNVLKSIRKITHHLQNTDQEIRQQRRDFLQLKDHLRGLYGEKKELVDSYDRQRKEYTNWSNANKSDRSCSLNWDCSYPATYPAAHRSQICDCASSIDEETLEPFYEQKMACKRLLEYLSSLQSQMSVEYSSSVYTLDDKSLKQVLADESDDSAEDYPLSFTALKKQTSLPARPCDEQGIEGTGKVPVSASRKKVCKKSSKKPCQKICHPVQMVCFFKEIEVPVPHTYRDIARTIETVQTLLKQYEEQTSSIVWEESDYRHLLSFSESEHTADSVCNGSTDMSERGSTYSFRQISSSSDLATAVPEVNEISSTDYPGQILENVTFLTISDEGITSKNSTC